MGQVIDNKFPSAKNMLFTLTAEAELIYSDSEASLVKLHYSYNGTKLDSVYQVIKHDKQGT